MAYEAPASNWLGTSMPLQDRAVNVLAHLDFHNLRKIMIPLAGHAAPWFTDPY
jgi:hypothetical protein